LLTMHGRDSSEQDFPTITYYTVVSDKHPCMFRHQIGGREQFGFMNYIMLAIILSNTLGIPSDLFYVLITRTKAD
jgi:hypothetical protein